MMVEYDVAVVGGGIVGLAQAWMAVRRGLKVGLFERSPVAQGASVRNFGMVWPIGQPAGELYALALKSREFWLELQQAGAVELETCGAYHLAHHADEMAVLEEFAALQTHTASLKTAAETLAAVPLANAQGLLGSLYSPTELRVNPRVASARIAAWLQEQLGVSLHFNTCITQVQENMLTASDGRSWRAEKIIICSGSDLQTLFPDVFAASGLRLCKLQMLKGRSSVRGATHGMPHIASGLTLRHYTSFLACPSLNAVKARVAQESPELDAFGIHVMASQFPSGDVILGDSHEYDAAITPFDKPEIDELMLRELKKVLHLDDWTIHERWHGIYAKHSTLEVVDQSLNQHVQIFVGPGGAGMTMSFGLAHRAWHHWTGN